MLSASSTERRRAFQRLPTTPTQMNDMGDPYTSPFSDVEPVFPQSLVGHAPVYQPTSQMGFNLTSMPPFSSALQSTIQSTTKSGAQTTQDANWESSRTWLNHTFGSSAGDANILADLLQHCHTTRQDYSDAITGFEMHNQIFLSGHGPMSKEDRDQYMRSYNAALTSARALFEPQEVYRNALSKLKLFTSDVIDSMPSRMSKDRRLLKRDHEMSMAVSKEKEEVVREMMRQLHANMKYVQTSTSLANYIQTMRKRLRNWQDDEETVEKYAKACLGALI